jgi:hypothetical protein
MSAACLVRVEPAAESAGLPPSHQVEASDESPLFACVGCHAVGLRVRVGVGVGRPLRGDVSAGAERRLQRAGRHEDRRRRSERRGPSYRDLPIEAPGDGPFRFRERVQPPELNETSFVTTDGQTYWLVLLFDQLNARFRRPSMAQGSGWLADLPDDRVCRLSPASAGQELSRG